MLTTRSVINVPRSTVLLVVVLAQRFHMPFSPNESLYRYNIENDWRSQTTGMLAIRYDISMSENTHTKSNKLAGSVEGYNYLVLGGFYSGRNVIA